MSYRRIDAGKALTLKLQLFDGDALKHPQAHVLDSLGAEIDNSPFDLIHIANGLYKAAGAVMPTGIYDVTYITYTDAGHTTESALHARASDEIDVRSEDILAEEGVILVAEDSENIILVEECE